MYITRRASEIHEWWKLRRNDPAAIERQQQREEISRRAEAENQSWLAGEDGAELGQYRTSSTPGDVTQIGPTPRGPQPKEIAGVVGVVLVLAILGSILNPKPEPIKSVAAPSITTAPTATVTTTAKKTTPSSSEAPVAPDDLPAVPVGKPQTLSGTNPDGGKYKATVTVTKVTRAETYEVTVDAVIDVTEGKVDTDGWQLVTAGEDHIDLNSFGDNGFGDTITRRAEASLTGSAGMDTRLQQVRFQPASNKYGTDSTNQAAVWDIGTIATSLPPEPTYTPGPGVGSDADLPNIDAPHPNGPCINGRRKGKFC